MTPEIGVKRELNLSLAASPTKLQRPDMNLLPASVLEDKHIDQISMLV